MPDARLISPKLCPKRMSYVLALDLGTSSVRVIAFDKKGSIVASAQQETASITPVNGWTEQDATALWAASCEVREFVATPVVLCMIGALCSGDR